MKKILPFPGAGKNRDADTILTDQLDQLYRLAFRFCGNRDDAEDLVQDLVTRLYPRREELLTIERPGTWLARALYNQFIDNVRRYQRSPVQVGDDDTIYELAPGDSGAEPDAVHARDRRLARLQLLAGKLSPEQRSLLALHDMEGYSLPELAEILDVPLGTLKSRLSRARNRLKELIKKDGTF